MPFFELDLETVQAHLQGQYSEHLMKTFQVIALTSCEMDGQTDGRTDRRRVIQYSPFLNFVETGDKNKDQRSNSSVVKALTDNRTDLTKYIIIFDNRDLFSTF